MTQSGPRTSFEAVFFDLDDTLMDRAATFRLYAEELYSQLNALWRREARMEEFVQAACLLDGRGYAPRDEFLGKLVDAFGREGAVARRERVVEELLARFHEGLGALAQAMPGMRETLESVRGAGLKSGLITNGTPRGQRRKLEALGIGAHLDLILISGEEGVHKPDPEIFHRACDRLDVPAHACLYVGDHPINDVAGARAARFAALWLAPREAPWPNELGAPEPPRIDRLADFPGWLASRSL